MRMKSPDVSKVIGKCTKPVSVKPNTFKSSGKPKNDFIFYFYKMEKYLLIRAQQSSVIQISY